MMGRAVSLVIPRQMGARHGSGDHADLPEVRILRGWNRGLGDRPQGFCRGAEAHASLVELLQKLRERTDGPAQTVDAIDEQHVVALLATPETACCRPGRSRVEPLIWSV